MYQGRIYIAGYGPYGKLVVPQTFMDHVYASRALDYLLPISRMCLYFLHIFIAESDPKNIS